MNRRTISMPRVGSVLALLVAVAVGLVVPAAVVAQGGPADDFEPLASGPIHEAFGQPINYDPAPGIVVPTAPPEPIEELPPDARPDGDNFEWISGYWMWDEDHKDFIWISGLWRDTPPGRRWVPGYWNKVEQGYQWVPGFWASQKVEEVRYLPVPPATLELGPNSPAPAEEYFWVPGYWQWRAERYAWRPGAWSPNHANWVWVPNHYVRTPGGCLFVSGYWDLLPPRRAMLFAPVYFRQHNIHRRAGFVYRPTIVIDTGLIAFHLFARPRCEHYYFGDYYGPSYVQLGIYPWYDFHLNRRGYDPIFAHDWHQHHRDNRWLDEVRGRHDYFSAHKTERPARTVAEARKHVGRDAVVHIVIDKKSDKKYDVPRRMVRSVDEVVADTKSRVHVQKVSVERREALKQSVQQSRQLAQLRMKSEGKGPGPKRAADATDQKPDKRGIAGAEARGPQDYTPRSWKLPQQTGRAATSLGTDTSPRRKGSSTDTRSAPRVKSNVQQGTPARPQLKTDGPARRKADGEKSGRDSGAVKRFDPTPTKSKDPSRTERPRASDRSNNQDRKKNDGRDSKKGKKN